MPRATGILRPNNNQRHYTPLAMGWRSARELSRVGKIVARATAMAEAHPVREDLCDSFYMGELVGDMIALRAVQRELD
jgi:hypothetical protein